MIECSKCGTEVQFRHSNPKVEGGRKLCASCFAKSVVDNKVVL